MLLPKQCLEENYSFRHHLSTPFHERSNKQKTLHKCMALSRQMKRPAPEHAFSDNFPLKASIPFILKAIN